MSALHELILKTQKIIEEKFHPDGYNIGINVGAAAGQSIPHLHVHIIPRYAGDVPNPRGSVRNVIPGAGDYTEKAKEEAKGGYLES